MKLIRYNYDDQRVNVGIAGDHQMTGLKLETLFSVVPSKQGDFLGIWNKYINCPNQKHSIHSKLQLWVHCVLIDTNLLSMNGGQHMHVSGYDIPIQVVAGLLYIDMSLPTQEQIDSLPHLI